MLSPNRRKRPSTPNTRIFINPLNHGSTLAVGGETFQLGTVNDILTIRHGTQITLLPVAGQELKQGDTIGYKVVKFDPYIPHKPPRF